MGKISLVVYLKIVIFIMWLFFNLIFSYYYMFFLQREINLFTIWDILHTLILDADLFTPEIA